MMHVLRILASIVLITLPLWGMNDPAAADSSGRPPVERESVPFYLHVDMSGPGMGIAIHRCADVQVSTLLFTSSTTLKIYLSEESSAPFVGLGSGRILQGFGGTGESNEWIIALAGWQWQPFPDRGLFAAGMVHYPLSSKNSKAILPTRFSLNVGIRLF